MTDLIAHHDWRQIETWELWNARGSLPDYLLNCFGALPHVILFWEGYEFVCARLAEIDRLDCRKAILADDLHWWNEAMRLRKLIAFGVCDTVLSTYAYNWDRFYPELAGIKKPEWVPHSAAPEFMLAYNPHPENSILLSGVIDTHYPLREQMKQLQTQGCYAIKHHPHPGYHYSFDHLTDTNVGRAYAEIINKHRVGFTDSGVYQYVVAKYFEIPATGALLLADDAVRAPLKELGFIENVHYFAVSSENCEEQVRYVLDESNREELDEIRRCGQQLVWEKHKTSDRARRIDEICARAN
jgi:hypothetical protein